MNYKVSTTIPMEDGCWSVRLSHDQGDSYLMVEMVWKDKTEASHAAAVDIEDLKKFLEMTGVFQ